MSHVPSPTAAQTSCHAAARTARKKPKGPPIFVHVPESDGGLAAAV